MYDYCNVPSYEDCLNILKECEAFTQHKQEKHGKIIESFKYAFHLPNMWDGSKHINMRGITFIDRKLVALPFPKFFNIGERAETREIDLNDANHIYEKVDGSLISFLNIEGKIACKTMRSIESDVAKEVEIYLEKRPDVREYAKELIEKNLSPMFEYVSPTQKIVISYDKNIIFLGCRDMETGKIFFPHHLDVPDSIDTPSLFNVNSMTKYMNKDDVEGVVVTMNDGLMFKMKTERYCKIHKLIEGITVKAILKYIIDDTIDDVYGVLEQNNLEKDKVFMKKVEEKYHNIYNELLTEAKELYERVKEKERKEIAFEIAKKKRKSVIGKLVFALVDNRYMELRNIINKHITKMEHKTWIFG